MKIWMAWVAGLMTYQSGVEIAAGNYAWCAFFVVLTLLNAGFAIGSERHGG